MNGFISELRRRNVFKVAIAYLVFAWLALEVAAVSFSFIEAPDSLTTAFGLILALGFPFALIIAWKYEMTPAGMKRTERIAPNEIIPYWSRRKFVTLLVTAGVLAAGLFLFQYLRQAKPARESRDGRFARGQFA